MHQKPIDKEEREHLWRALEASEARFRAIVHRNADGVVVVGTNGVIRYVNPAAETLLGRPANRLVGQMFGVPVAPGEATEVELLKSDGAQCVAEMRIVETQWQGQCAFLATLRDVTERKQREIEAREAVRRRDQFLAMLSHELRNPLAAIVNAAYILRRKKPADERLRRACEVVDGQSQHMVRLLDDLLDVSRISRGMIELRRQRLDAVPLLAETARSVGATMEKNGIALTVDLPAAGLYVEVDPARMHQVVVNLLTNAARYNNPGGNVCLRAWQEQDEVFVSVDDDGIGIEEAKLQSIFEPFFQGETTLARSDAGLGIGLSLVRLLVELHGGRVSAHSDGPGCGSRFSFALPAVEVPAGSAVPTDCEAQVEGVCIQVIEDSDTAREMLKSLLEMEGHEVQTAANGEEGLAMLQSGRPDVALVDIGLPVIDGYEIARRVKADPALAKIFLIALTGYGQPEDERRATEAGFDAHMVKPLDLGRFCDLLAEHMQCKLSPAPREVVGP